VISGSVTDAGTGRLVPKFRLVQGERLKKRDEIWWSENDGVEVVGGHYRVRIGAAGDGALIRVEATGYKSAVSRAFQAKEGSQTFDFALQRAPGLSGIVLLSDGKTTAQAEIAVATSENWVRLESGRLDRSGNHPLVATGPDGRFTLPPRDDKFLLIAVLHLNDRDLGRRRVPVTFLIGPDGRVVAHDLIGSELEAVRKALDNPKLFPRPTNTAGPPGSPPA
jgi:hypothetical protein